MKLYEIETDKIVNLKKIYKNKTTYLLYDTVEPDWVLLKTLGYLKVDNSNIKSDTIFETYSQVPAIYDDVCVIKYYKNENTLDSVKSIMINQVNTYAKSIIDKATEKYSAGEMAMWNTLEQEATNYITNGDITICPNIKEEADLCGQTYTELSNEIINNATTFKSARATIVSTRYNLNKSITQATTIDELKFIQNSVNTFGGV